MPSQVNCCKCDTSGSQMGGFISLWPLKWEYTCPFPLCANMVALKLWPWRWATWKGRLPSYNSNHRRRSSLQEYFLLKREQVTCSQMILILMILASIIISLTPHLHSSKVECSPALRPSCDRLTFCRSHAVRHWAFVAGMKAELISRT